MSKLQALQQGQPPEQPVTLAAVQPKPAQQATGPQAPPATEGSKGGNEAAKALLALLAQAAQGGDQPQTELQAPSLGALGQQQAPQMPAGFPPAQPAQ